MSHAYVNIGLLLYWQGQLEEALKYYNLSLILKKEIKDKRGEALLYNNIGATYYYLEKYDSVLYNFKQALAIYQS